MLLGPELWALRDIHSKPCLSVVRVTELEEEKMSYCRSLVSRLEEVDPKKMKHEEKLAFWINVHNVLVMHVIILQLLHS